MSGTSRNVSIRLSVEGAEVVRKALQETGQSGSTALATLDQATQRAAAGMTKLRGEAVQSAAGGRNFGAMIGQAGFQLQDFAVQVQGGTSALTALSQQGSQLLGVFGAGGAIAGAALTAGLLAAQIGGLGGQTNLLEAATKSVDASYKRLNEAAEQRVKGIEEEAAAITRLTGAYTSLGVSGRRAEGILLDRQRLSLAAADAALRRQGTSVFDPRTTALGVGQQSNAGDFSVNLVEAPVSRDPATVAAIAATQAYEAQTILTARAQRDYAAALDEAAKLGGTNARAIINQRDAVLALLPSVTELEGAQRQAATQTIALMQAQGAGAAQIQAYAQRFGELAPEILRAAEAIQQLRRIQLSNPALAVQQEAANIEAQLGALRRGGIEVQDAERRAQEGSARATEVSNRVYREQLELRRQRGDADPDAGARAAAAEALREQLRLNQLSETLRAERARAEDAQREADRAARRDASEARAAARADARDQERDEAGFARQEQRARQAAQRALSEAGRMKNLGEQTRQASDAARELGLTFSSAFEEAIIGGKSLQDILRGLEQDLLRLGTRKLVTEPLVNAVSGVLSPQGGSGGTFDWMKLIGTVGGIVAGAYGGGMKGPESAGTFTGTASGMNNGVRVFHGGGIVGQGGLSRAMPAWVWDGAPRYHSGGVAGLAPDEVPIIAQRGERILSREQVARGGGGGGVVNMTVVTRDANSFRASQGQVLRDMNRGISRGQRNA